MCMCKCIVHVQMYVHDYHRMYFAMFQLLQCSVEDLIGIEKLIKKRAGTKCCDISVRSLSVPVLPICTVYYAYYLRVDCPRDNGFQWKKTANGKYDRAEWKIRPRQELNDPSL